MNWSLLDIREVPFEMPMCLLAGDEGNEEEIMKLLESESPRLSPHKPQKNNIAQQNKDGENFIMPNSSSSLDPSDVGKNVSYYTISLNFAYISL